MINQDHASSSATEPSGAPRLPVLGAILAGGASRRFGSPKALARVEGVALVERVRDVLAEVVAHPVVITHLPAVAALAGLPSRPDRQPGAGPLAGIETALRWAAELGLPGALCAACDLPFLSPGLVRALVLRGLRDGESAVLPESGAPAGVEPLCAWYSVAALPSVETAIASGERSATRAALALGAGRLPLVEVARHGDPSLLFLNVNTPEGRDRAEDVAGSRVGCDV